MNKNFISLALKASAACIIYFQLEIIIRAPTHMQIKHLHIRFKCIKELFLYLSI